MQLATVGADAALFVFARVPGERAPVAVIRQPVSALPGTFTLSDADVMIAGRSLASFPELSLVARISRSGQPAEQAGDLYAETTYGRGADPKVALVIDRVVP
jgi:cytochrome c-type biogenesis protein CcmH